LILLICGYWLLREFINLELNPWRKEAFPGDVWEGWAVEDESDACPCGGERARDVDTPANDCRLLAKADEATLRLEGREDC